MTLVARELPRGSGRWTTVNEPAKRHPREAPQFECSFCERVIGKTRTIYLVEGNRAVCSRCLTRAAHAKLFPRCQERWHDAIDHLESSGTRAGIACVLGIWPGKPDAAKVTFRQWLKQFTGEQSGIGDLARDMYADRRWPRGPGSLAKCEAYLEGAGACDSALEALRAAWARYERERRATR